MRASTRPRAEPSEPNRARKGNDGRHRGNANPSLGPTTLLRRRGDPDASTAHRELVGQKGNSLGVHSCLATRLSLRECSTDSVTSGSRNAQLSAPNRPVGPPGPRHSACLRKRGLRPPRRMCYGPHTPTTTSCWSAHTSPRSADSVRRTAARPLGSWPACPSSPTRKRGCGPVPPAASRSIADGRRSAHPLPGPRSPRRCSRHRRQTRRSTTSPGHGETSCGRPASGRRARPAPVGEHLGQRG